MGQNCCAELPQHRVYDAFRADGGRTVIPGGDDITAPKLYDKVPFPMVPEPTITSPYILKKLAELPTLIPKVEYERGSYLSARRINTTGFVYTG